MALQVVPVVKGALHPKTVPVEDVEILLRCFDAAVTENLLDRTNVVAILEQVCGEGVPERMTVHGFMDTG